jgi:DNA-damage-inducible protein J
LAGSIAVRDRVPKEKALPFEPLDPNARTIRAMNEARNGKFKRFERVEDLMIELKAKV